MATPPPFSDSQKSALVQQIIQGDMSLREACERHGVSTEQLKEWIRVFRRAVRQALDNQLHNTLSVQGLELGDLSRAELSGDLSDISIADLMQTVQMGRKNAHISVVHGDDVSEIWCQGGEVVDARSGSLRGEAAFCRVFGLCRGRVVADFAPLEHERRIQLDTPRLLLEAASSKGLRERLAQRIGDPAQVLCVDTQLSARHSGRLGSDELAVLSAFDGVRSIEEVLFACRLPDARALDIVARFRESRWLVPRPAPDLQDTRRSQPPPSSNLTMSYAARVVQAAREQQTPSAWILACGALLCSSLGALSAIAYANARQPAGGAPPLVSAELAPALPLEAPGGPAPAARAVPGAALALPAPALPSLPPRAARCPEGMVWIEGGEFTMGTNSDSPALSLAQPAHRVRMSGFCLGVHEVTLAEYGACSEQGSCSPAHQTAHFAAETQEGSESDAWLAVHGAMCNAGKAERGEHPVNCVSHEQATRYCAAQGARLPSEAEWEFAARGPRSLDYPWGSAKPTRAHVNACGTECERWHEKRGLAAEVHGLMYGGDDGYAGTAPVGSFPLGATADGVQDMIGNVFEWTSGGLYDYQDERAVDPEGPRDADSFVIRGGNFNSGIAEFADPALRFAMHRDSYSHGVGFRCAADPRRTLVSARP